MPRQTGMPVGRQGRGPLWWHGKFQGCGYRITVPRQIILSVLSKTSEHLSAEDIYIAVHKTCPNVGLTTVYRTLELLSDMRIVYKFDFGDRRARYELSEGSKGKRHHHHLVCTECGRIIDYTDFIDKEVDLLSNTKKGLAKKYNFEINNYLIQFYGLCSGCRNE